MGRTWMRLKIVASTASPKTPPGMTKRKATSSSTLNSLCLCHILIAWPR
jgi:hypothetical protein